MNIAFDLDEVLVDTITLFRQIAEQKCYTTHDHIQYKLSNNSQFSKPEMSDATVHYIFSQVYEAYWKTKPYKDVPGTLKWLYKKTKDPIRIITNRPIYAASSTHYLVDDFCKVPYEIIFTNGYSKLDYLKGTGYFVEDRRKTAIELANAGKTVFMPERTWNKFSDSHPGIKRISSITEILKYSNIIK